MAGRRRSRGGSVHFPAREARSYHLVFGGADLREWAWLDPGELAERAVRRLAGRGDPRMVRLVQELIDRGEAVALEALERPPGPPLPPVVAPAGIERAAPRLERATHVLRVDARNPASAEVGFPGLWCAHAVAAAAASATDGVWFDAAALRLRDAERDAPAPAFGAVPMGDHLLLTQAQGSAGSVALATHGLAAFGLPDLVVSGVPAPSAPAAGLLLQGVAQRLVEGLLDDLRSAARGQLPHELVVTSAHVAHAAPGGRVREGAAVRLVLVHRASAGDDDHLEVEPTGADASRSRADWLRLVLADLLSA